MTADEARTVLNIMTGADGGCSHCAQSLAESFIRRFGFRELANEVFAKEFPLETDDEEWF